jgi:type IV pilus assembly protein PilZ
MEQQTTSGASRPSVLSLNIKERAGLYAAYMPFITQGGLFVPTQKSYNLGEEVVVILTLIDDPQRYPLTGKVVWVAPSGLATRAQGIGIQLPADEVGTKLKIKIEGLLGSAMASSRKTHTL